jgi:hypothetical protein
MLADIAQSIPPEKTYRVSKGQNHRNFGLYQNVNNRHKAKSTMPLVGIAQALLREWAKKLLDGGYFALLKYQKLPVRLTPYRV